MGGGGRFLAALFLLFLGAARVAAQATVPVAFRISCGSAEDYTTAEHSWSKDYGYSSGSVGNLTADKARESGYTTLRYFSSSDGPNNCYNVTVPNGHYLVRFFFSFGQADNANREPQFDVSLEGTLGFSLKPGWSNTEDTSYADALVFVDDTTATACFHSSGHGNPAVVTIEILQLYDNAYDLGFGPANHHYLLNAVARVSCGAQRAAYGTTLGANEWGGDRYWSQDLYRSQTPNVDTLVTPEPIRNANVPPNFYPQPIYQGATIGKSDASVSYAFPIDPSRNYSIWLHFAELDTNITAAGQRVFDVLYNEQELFTDVDVWSLAGGSNAAVVLNTTVLVDGRTLTLTFQPKFGNILVCAVEVYEIMEREYVTRSEEVWALQALKPSLGIPPRMGWYGDPCVPQEHPWDGIDCKLDNVQGIWVIDGLDFENDGLKGMITNDISVLTSVDHINLNGNILRGPIPDVFGNLTHLTRLDLADNMFNGSIPPSLGMLLNLTELYLNNNDFTGKVPDNLSAGPLRGASFNFLGNPGLCGVPGLRSCRRFSVAATAAIVFGILSAAGLLALGIYILWKRNENIARTNRILAPPKAPYAASRTSSIEKNVQLSRYTSFTDTV